MLRRLSNPARAAVGQALLSAQESRHDAVTPTDLADGLMRTLPDSVAALIATSGVPAPSAPGSEAPAGPVSASPALPFSVEALELLEAAAAEADRRGHLTVTALHLLSAMLVAPPADLRDHLDIRETEQLEVWRAHVAQGLASDPRE